MDACSLLIANLQSVIPIQPGPCPLTSPLSIPAQAWQHGRSELTSFQESVGDMACFVAPPCCVTRGRKRILTAF